MVEECGRDFVDGVLAFVLAGKATESKAVATQATNIEGYYIGRTKSRIVGVCIRPKITTPISTTFYSAAQKRPIRIAYSIASKA